MNFKQIKTVLLLLVVFGVTFAGCGDETASSTSSDGVSTPTPTEATFDLTDDDMFTERDGEIEVDEKNAIAVLLNGSTAECSSKNVEISGTKVTVKADGTYIFSGSMDNGMIIVDAGDTAKPQIVLKGATVNSGSSAALYVKTADKVFVTLYDGTQNSLTNGGSFTAIDENNIDSALFSKADLTLNGKGSLTVNSPAGHGIVSKDDLVVTGGSYTLTTSAHAIDANDSVRISDSTFGIASGKDGIHCENDEDAEKGFVYISSGNFDIIAQGDGISASNYLQIMKGSFNIVTGGGYENGQKQTSDNWGQPGGQMGGGHMGGGMRPGPRTVEPTAATVTETTTDDASDSIKGLKAQGSLLISDGSFTINSADDAVHSNLSVTIKGGTFNIKTGDDGVHSDETLTVSGGNITVNESYEGLEGLHIAVSGGSVTLTARDDGLNAAGGTDQSGFGGDRGGDMFGGKGGMSSGNGSIVISGGTLNITASGDGIDANGTLEIKGGTTTVTGPTQGDTATLDYDRSATISGGTFIGTGAQGMAQTFSDSSQGVISVSVGNGAASTKITLKDKKGNVIIDHTPSLNYAIVILSSPNIKSGETYSLTVGSYTADVTAN